MRGEAKKREQKKTQLLDYKWGRIPEIRTAGGRLGLDLHGRTKRPLRTEWKTPQGICFQRGISAHLEGEFKIKEEATRKKEEEVYSDASKNGNNEGAMKWREEETEAELQWRDDELRKNLEQGRRFARAKLHKKYMDNNFVYYFRIKIKKL